MFGSWLRRAGFWVMDTAKGGEIRAHYNDIRRKIENNYDTKEELISLLEHAGNTVPFYKDIKRKDLTDFPVVNKSIYKDNYDSFQSSDYKGKVLHHMSTSGSTGTPFTVNQDANKRKRTIADLIYFNTVSGQYLGDKFIWLHVITENNEKSKLTSFQQNVIDFDTLHLDENTLENLRELLKKDKALNSMLGYSSSYDTLVNYLLQKGDKPEMYNLKSIFSVSGLLTPSTKSSLETIFGCPVINRYANQENGVLAQTKPYEDTFRINNASFKIELLELERDKPAKPGQLGRVVVTDLYNFAMPIIRYDTGDLATSEDNNGRINNIHSIQGRRIDIIYDTKGNKLTPHTCSVYMRKFSNLKQWQFIQEDAKNYVLKVNGADGVYTTKEFDNTLRPILGADAKLEVRYVDEIPILASGKFKNTICNYKPKDPTHKN